MLRRTFIMAGAAAVASLRAPLARAQSAGSPVRIVFPFGAGGAGDALCRLLAERLAPALGRAVIVENRTGADGRIGIGSVKAAPPNGDTILITTGPTMWLMAMVHKSPGYDPFTDFEPVSHLCSFEFCIAVSLGTGLTSIKELVAWAKANPDKATYGLPGVGTIPHMTGVALSRMIGVDMRRLPYRGGALAMNDLVAGQIPLSIGTLSDALQQHRGGKVRILAVTSEKRSPFVPDVPTMVESGYNLVGEAWYGMWMPKGTPAEIVAKVSGAVQAAIAAPDVRQRLEGLGLIATGTPPDRLTAIMRENRERWAAVVKESGYTIEQ